MSYCGPQKNWESEHRCTVTLTPTQIVGFTIKIKIGYIIVFIAGKLGFWPRLVCDTKWIKVPHTLLLCPLFSSLRLETD